MATILAPNVNFIPTSPRQIIDPELSALRWDMHELTDRLATYGYDGTELHWVKAAKHCRELQAATAEQARAIGKAIATAHEGWVSTANPEPADASFPRRELEERKNVLVSLGSALLLPTGQKSLDHLEQTEAKLGRDSPMHYVLFPDETGQLEADQRKTERFPNSSIQPTADVGAAWGVRTVGDFVRQLRARGYKATLDDFHLSRRGKIVDDALRWQSLAEALLAQSLVPEVHISVGRSDFAHIDPERYKLSVKELRALVDNGSLDGTPLGEFFDLLEKYKWNGNTVVEATMPGLQTTFGKLTPKLVEEIHKNVSTNVRERITR